MDRPEAIVTAFPAAPLGSLRMFSLRDRKSPRDETAKLTATFVNGIAIGITVVGSIAPLVNAMGYGGYPAASTASLILSGSGCLILSFALHLSARYFLKRELSR